VFSFFVQYKNKISLLSLPFANILLKH